MSINYLNIFSKQILLLLLIGMSLFSSCSSAEKRSEDDRQLAQAFDKSLYLSDLEGMIPEGMSSEDSSLIISAFRERWLRDAVMMHEAEQSIPTNLNLDKLVRDYRASLVRLNYEKVLVEELLDSTIAQVEVKEFYEKNKAQYQLETPIIQCRFIKIDRSKAGVNQLQQWWNNGSPASLEQIKAYCLENAAISQLQDSTWLKVDDIAGYMPPGILTVDNVSRRRDFVQKEDNFIYFFKVLDLVSKTEFAPISYVKDQARKVILHRRKMKVLDDMKQKMYEEALRKKNIQTF
ncbi:MAG: hypothetical protein ACI9XO_002119 [Paraglaciecola sp.]